jgi:hypothetical protein
MVEWMDLDRQQLIALFEQKGYRVGTDSNPDVIPVDHIGLYREINSGCLWAFGEKLLVHAGTLDVARNELRVYGSSLMPEMNKVKESLEEMCVKRFYLTLADEDIAYVD